MQLYLHFQGFKIFLDRINQMPNVKPRPAFAIAICSPVNDMGRHRRSLFFFSTWLTLYSGIANINSSTLTFHATLPPFSGF